MTRQTGTTAPASPTEYAVNAGSYVDWPSIFAGAIIASGIAFVFSTFGVALGLGMVSPYEGDGSATAELIAVGSWIIWTTVSSVMAGSYVAGRMRRRIEAANPDEASVRDGIHGLAVWGVAMLVGALLVTGVVTAAANVAADTSGAVATLPQNLVPQEGATVDEGVGLDAGTVSDTEAAVIAETARKYSILSAFVLAAAQLIAGAGAYWAAGMGGQHRDESRVFARFGRWV